MPGGLGAYPECQAKGALVRNLLDSVAVPDVLPHLPAELRALAADPPVGSEWVPEVSFGALLLAISEHTSFATAYLVSASAAVLLVAGYSRSILRSTTIAVTIGTLMTCLYGFLYVTMQLEDYALLIGSCGLLVVLGGVMYLTRRIDWYAISAEKSFEFSVIEEERP